MFVGDNIVAFHGVGKATQHNILVWDCYDSNYDHLWTLEDVEEFIKGEYEKAEIEY